MDDSIGHDDPGLVDDVATVDVVDSVPRRIRRSVDLVRLVGLLLVLFVLGTLGSAAGNTSRDLSADLAHLFGGPPGLVLRALSISGAIGVLAVPLGFVVKEIVGGQTRRLIEALLTGLLAIGVVRGLDIILAEFGSSALYRAMIELDHRTSVRPLDAYLAALLALVTMTQVASDRLWRSLFLAAGGVYVTAAFASAQASLLSLVASPIVGITVAVAVRYVAGSVNDRPTGQQIAGELAKRDLELTRMERVTIENEGHRTYQARTRDGIQLTLHVFDRDLITSGALYGVYRQIRVRTEITPIPALSLERLAEHRSLLAMAAVAAGARVPALVSGLPYGNDTIVLAYQWISGTPLNELPEPPTDVALGELWGEVGRMHRHRITHRGLTPGEILLDTSGHVVLPIPKEGAAFATDLRITLDRAQLLMTTAELVGADLAVHIARTRLSDEELASILPILQPIVLPRETRTSLRHHPGLLEDVRDQIQDQTHQPPPELSRVERVRPLAVVTIVAGIVAAYLLVGQLGSVDLITVFSSARWRWIPFVALASAATYAAAALSLTGFVRERLSFARTVLAQLAASFTGFVTPPAVGGLAVNIRFLQKAGLSTTGAATSVGMSQVVNAVSHVLLLIGFAAATGVSSNHRQPVPGWAFLALGAIAVTVLLILAIPIPRRWLLERLLPPLREALPRLLNLVTRPVKLGQAVGGTILLNFAYILALWCAVQSFAGTIDFAAVAVVYLTGAAIASAAPTPGGLGAVELALSTGLAAAGMSSAAAVSAVLLYRLATFWLPVPIGWVALQWLRRVDAL
jgi:uncharacterized membrane protein YbhN (UPF0104 family)